MNLKELKSYRVCFLSTRKSIKSQQLKDNREISKYLEINTLLNNPWSQTGSCKRKFKNKIKNCINEIKIQYIIVCTVYLKKG